MSGTADPGGDTLFLIRAMRLDPVAQALAETLARASGRAPVFVCDERRGIADTGSFPKVSLTESVADDLGLAGRPANWGWFCGDFCYYAAARAHPGHAFYCLIDADVWFSGIALRAFVDGLARRGEDGLAVRLGDQGSDQRYSRGLAALGLSPRLGCIFPLTRVSAGLLAAMHALRRESLGRSPVPLNDEAVLAGATWRGGFSHAALETAFPGMFDPKSFETNPPHLFEGLLARSEDPAAYHPVVTRETVLARIESGEKNYSHHRLRRIFQEAPPAMRREIRAAADRAAAKGNAR